MKASIKTLSPVFNSNRMVQQYVENSYLNAYRQFRILANEHFAELKSLASWHKHLLDKWADVRIIEVSSPSPARISVDDQLEVRAKVFMGELKPEDVSVELYLGRLSQRGEIANAETLEMTPDGAPQSGVFNYVCRVPMKASGRLGYSVRVLPGHRSLVHPHELRLVSWADGGA